MDLGALLLCLSLTCHVGQVVEPAPQAPQAAAPAPPPAAWWSAGVEYQHDRFDYRFENPSSYDGSERVPHDFEQRYDAGSVWLSGRLHFVLGTRPFETEGGVSAPATGTGSDYDTFRQPDGNVIVYGTTAVTDAWSWRAAQHVGLGSWLGLRWRAAYSYRRDRAHFRPSYTTIAQTKPPSSSAFWNTDRETTISEVHEVRIGAERPFSPGPGWRVRVTADAAPTTLARLTTQLPDKYPDPVVFIAKSLSVNAALHVTRRVGRWRVGAAVTYAQAWPYSQSSAYRRRAVSAAATFGR